MNLDSWKLVQGKSIQDGNDTLTFHNFLSRIENEDKLLKNPKNYSLKVMEARKTKGNDNFSKHD